ncbi:glutamate dehydrogenase [Paratrimastix pyriformis]|uniref:Glutamate dehydrogenase n=1 Tax=Paratrimastix pyriformis TaxID=342808 RepID=A0ABQ8UCY7_9EUKA|nr:glutamate dehydrogenase [Paratrimastix pyriformis]
MAGRAAAERILAIVDKRDPHQPEFRQAVKEVVESLIPVFDVHPEYADVMERLVEPERAIQFRVAWLDDKGKIQVNRGFRVQYNQAIGPYKGGLRFHPSVNLSIIKFLGFEQIFKNSLTTLPMGGAKGGSDFDARGKSEGEIMRFCQSFMTELARHIGADCDVPAGDIGVGGKEIGYMFGQYKRLTKNFEGVLTGKGQTWGGSLIRPEATGYGLTYFVQEMLKTRNTTLTGKTVCVSGFGNVCWGTCLKVTELGGKVVTISGPDGYIYDAAGLNAEKIAYLLEIRASNNDVVAPYAQRFPGSQFHAGKKPWEVKCDVAMTCATQNELNGDDARQLVANGCMCVGEGSNMGCTPEAIEVLQHAGLLFSPGKASNAGGVAVSGLEMSQNSMRLRWTSQEVDQHLQRIMRDIHEQCLTACRRFNKGQDYLFGANAAGFLKVCQAMIEQGCV